MGIVVYIGTEKNRKGFWGRIEDRYPKILKKYPWEVLTFFFIWVVVEEVKVNFYVMRKPNYSSHTNQLP